MKPALGLVRNETGGFVGRRAERPVIVSLNGTFSFTHYRFCDVDQQQHFCGNAAPSSAQLPLPRRR